MSEPKRVVKVGKTPVLDPSEARILLDSIDVTTPVGLRDRALIGLMVCTTTPHGRLMLTVLGGLAEFERELIRARTR